MSAPDELLARLVLSWMSLPSGGSGDADDAAGLARMLRDRGYQRLRTVTTAEELDALPVGSVVKDEDGHAHLKYPRGWVRTGQEPFSVAEGILPALVIHEAAR